MQMRFDTWRDSISAVEAHPNGTGLGTVGRATSLTGPTVTTDSSYLKIYREQGVLVGSVFVVGIFGLCIALVRRIRRIRHEPRPLAVSALAGFLAVLVMWTFGEFVEQPGKTVAWTFLGLALADATLDRVHSPASPLLTLDAVRRIAPTAARTRIVVFALATVLLAIPIMLNVFRTAHYEASIEAVLESGSGRTLPSARSVAAVERFLRDRFVLASVVRTSHVPIKPASVGDDVRLGVSHGRLLIAARADSPDRATRLAAATGAALADASTRDPADWRVVLGPREAAPPPSGLVDRALSRLPGPLPPRPSLFWTVVAGAVLAAGLIAAWSSDHASR